MSTEIDISGLNLPADLTLVLTPSKDSEIAAKMDIRTIGDSALVGSTVQLPTSLGASNGSFGH